MVVDTSIVQMEEPPVRMIDTTLEPRGKVGAAQEVHDVHVVGAEKSFFTSP